MQAAILTAHACTVHNRVFVTPLNSWLSLNYPPVSTAFEDAAFREAACDYCLLTARSLFELQFPHLYASVSFPRPDECVSF
jgi:hypothetical protein